MIGGVGADVLVVEQVPTGACIEADQPAYHGADASQNQAELETKPHGKFVSFQGQPHPVSREGCIWVKTLQGPTLMRTASMRRNSPVVPAISPSGTGSCQPSPCT